MKILHLIDSGGLYGAEKMLLSLVAGQVEQGLYPMILSAGEPEVGEKPLEAEARRLGLPVTTWRMKPGINLREASRIIQWALQEGYDLLHSHGYKFNVLVGIWPARMRLPLVTTLHGYVHAPRFSKMWLYELLDRFMLFRTQAVVLVNEGMKAELGRALRGAGRVHVIPNGVDVSNIEACARADLPAEITSFLQDHSPVVLGVGRLSGEKGFDRLIEAFAVLRKQHVEAGLLIVGEGKLRKELEALVRRHSLERSVLMPGYYENVPALMARSSALAIPSRTEGLPITILEAMATGLPIIASAVGAIPKALDHGRGGIVIEELDAQRLAIGLCECFSNTPEANLKAERAIDKVQKDYSSSAMTREYTRIYQKVIA